MNDKVCEPENHLEAMNILINDTGIDFSVNTQNMEEKFSEYSSKRNEKNISNKKQPILKEIRSLSEGSTIIPPLTEDENVTIFPNMHDDILQSIGLYCEDLPREPLNEVEIEAKFHTLLLIFAIDAKSVAQRRMLQQRQRDQAEDNMTTEVARFEHAVRRLSPLCTDAESSEIISTILARLHILLKASQRISTTNQIYGGVQQEYRLTAAVNLMLLHLRNMQQQRDAAKQQLQDTKKMLQETAIVTETNIVNNNSVILNPINRRIITRRRASIATIPRPLDSPSASGPAGIAATTKRAVRRISADAYTEAAPRLWELKNRTEWMPQERTQLVTRLSRPSRLELNLDLSKIHEGSVDTTTNDNDSDNALYLTPDSLPEAFFLTNQSQVHELNTFSDHLLNVLSAFCKFFIFCWNRWITNGTLREIVFFILLICFTISFIIVLNTWIWKKLINQEFLYIKIPRFWVILEKFCSLCKNFFNLR